MSDILKNIILRREEMGEAKDAIHVAFGVDAGYCLGMGILLESILAHNFACRFCFHVFTDNIYEKDLLRLRRLQREHENCAFKFYYLDKKKLQSFKTNSKVSHATYYRFIMPVELYGKTEKFIYMDSDMLCTGDLKELWDARFDGNIAMAAGDLAGMAEYAKKEIAFAGDKYFNAGMMFINVSAWNEAAISDKAVARLRAGCDYKYLDQDLLNLLLCGRVKFIPSKWNVIYNLVFMRQPLDGDTRLIHFAGTAKPWQEWAGECALTEKYREFWRATLWQDEPLQQPLTYKQAKYMYRKHKLMGNFGKAAKWYAAYTVRKLKKK